MTETIWLALVGVLVTALFAVIAADYWSQRRRIARCEMKIGEGVAIMLALWVEMPVDKRELLTKAIQVLVKNGHD